MYTLAILVTGMLIGAVASIWAIKLALRQVPEWLVLSLLGMQHDNSPDQRDHIKLELEMSGKTFLCYDMNTKEFVCQGSSAAEVQHNFVTRFPNKTAAIVGGDASAVDCFKQQIKES